MNKTYQAFLDQQKLIQRLEVRKKQSPATQAAAIYPHLPSKMQPKGKALNTTEEGTNNG